MWRMIKLNREALQGSMLLDAIFEHFWELEKKVIKKLAYRPFLFYWGMANFYYT